jgi:hypothetical protein
MSVANELFSALDAELRRRDLMGELCTAMEADRH